MELLAKVGHEFSPRRDRVAVEQIRHTLALGLHLLLEQGSVTRTTEPTGSLLVHLGARGHAIDSEEDMESDEEMEAGYSDIMDEEERAQEIADKEDEEER